MMDDKMMNSLGGWRLIYYLIEGIMNLGPLTLRDSKARIRKMLAGQI